MKTSDRKIAKQHIAHLRRREDYLRAKVVAAGPDADGWGWHTDEWARGSGDLLGWLPVGPNV